MKAVTAVVVVAIVLSASVLSVAAYAWLIQPGLSAGSAMPQGQTGTYSGGYPAVAGSPMTGGTSSWVGPNGGTSAYGTPTPAGAMRISEVTAMAGFPPSHAGVNRTADTIVFDSMEVNLLVLSMMPDDAANMTGMHPPSYSTGDVFVIGGLIDPTLVFRRGTELNVTVVNMDDDMYHNFVLTTLPPPYDYMMMASGGSMGPGMMSSAETTLLSTMPMLPPVDDAQGYASAYTYSVTLNASSAIWYVCTYPGHAQSGMYGEVTFTS